MSCVGEGLMAVVGAVRRKTQRERQGGMEEDKEKREESGLRPTWRSPIGDFQFFFKEKE